MKKTPRIINSGFTLIEILAATSILVMLMLTATSMLMTTVLSQARGSIRAQLKDEGSAMMQRITYNLRNAGEITSLCAPTGTTATQISYKNDAEETIYTFEKIGQTIALNDGTTPIILHTGAVLPSLFNVTCTSDEGSGMKFIIINLTLTNVQTGEFNADAGDITENFSSSVQFRNYQAN